MIFKNNKTIQNVLIIFTVRIWLIWLAYQPGTVPKTCLALEKFEELIDELKDNEFVDPSKGTKVKGEDAELVITKTVDILDVGCAQNEEENCENGVSPTGPNHMVKGHACRFFKSTKRLICNGSIDYAYLQRLRSEHINDFIVENYEAGSLYKKMYWSRKNLETGEWYLKLPKMYQKLTGEVQLKDTGLLINLHIRLIPRVDSKGFLVEGEAFSNKVLKISWKLKGNLSLDFVREKTLISLDVGAIGDDDWRLQSNLTFLRRAAEDESDIWQTKGIIESDYVSENQFVFYKGTVWSKMVKEECKFLGEFKLQGTNLEASLSGNVAPPQKKQITIPKSAFSNMTIRNIVFKDSNFYNDFDRNSFEGLRALKRISFIDSKLEVLPRLDELFQSFSDLEEINIDHCVAPRLKFGALSPLTKVRRLSLQGTGPLSFDDSSFLWLKNSNLTYLSLQNSHVKILAAANSVLWSVNSTLKYLDISHSTLNGEKDLIQILRNTNIVSLTADGLKLRKIPISALGSVRQTLTYLSLRENDFRKNFEKLFDSILNFPLMPNMVELNLEECHINYIEKGTFDNLPNLRTLHLSYNNLENVHDGWAEVSPVLTYLSLSHNGFTPHASSMALYDTGTSMNLEKFKGLEILDLSNGIFTNMNKLIASLGSNLRNLTVRNTGLEDLPEYAFENLTGLEVLDLSYNRNLKTVQPFSFNLFKNLKNLKSLDLKHCKISGGVIQPDDVIEVSSDESFKLENLQSLDLSANNFKIINPEILKAFPNLKILNLSGNGISDWGTTIALGEHLESVFLNENKIEGISNEMLSDIKRLKHVKLGNNPFVCGSYVYDIIKIVNAKSGNPQADRDLKESDFGDIQESEYIKKMFYRITKNHESTNKGNVKILDWSDKNYICFSLSQAKFIPFTQVDEYFESPPEKSNETMLLWFTVAIVVGIVITVAIICWKFLDIHLITSAVRSAVALSFIARNEKAPANFKYNVFVSYSDKDRTWVVDNLLPRLESNNEVKVCLHERDFQVGLSIIENILNSIESSRNIILVVSQAFLKSQWCQYEMQLAQFRLLEKGRDQLILIFLENIPVLKRPKTLRYLMMTKTYLEWPVNPRNNREIDNFWNRLMKSIVNLS